MICSNLNKLIGFTCHPLDESGSVAMIETPFCYADNDGISLFVEKIGAKYRFFDDGTVIMHFAGRGMSLSSGRSLRFISNACSAHGVNLNDQGEVEVWSSEDDPSDGFSKMIGALHSLVAWETEHAETSTDAALFIEDVAMCLQAIKPASRIARSPIIAGLSKQSHTFDFDWDGVIVAAITPHHAAVGGLLRKLIDVKGSPHHQSIETLVVIDDRSDAKAADREMTVISGVSKIVGMRALQEKANLSEPRH